MAGITGGHADGNADSKKRLSVISPSHRGQMVEITGGRADGNADNTTRPSVASMETENSHQSGSHQSVKMARSTLFQNVLLRHEKLLKKQTRRLEDRLRFDFASLLAEFARRSLNDQKDFHHEFRERSFPDVLNDQTELNHELNHEFRERSIPEPICISSLTKVSISPSMFPSEQLPEPGTGLPDLPSYDPDAVSVSSSVFSSAEGLRDPPPDAEEPHQSVRRNSFRLTVANFGHSIVLPDRSWILQKQNNRNAVVRCVWKFLDDPESGSNARIFNMLMPWFTIGTVLFTVMGSTYWIDGSSLPGILAELIIDTIFTIEVLARLLTCPSMGQFFLDAYNIIDVVSVAPFVCRILTVLDTMNGQSLYIQYLFLCYVPVLRLLKLLRRFRQCRLLLEAFTRAFEALPVILFCYCVILLFFSALIFTFERWQNSKVNSLLDAMWLTVVSMTTVGYGDIVPITPIGKLIAAFLTLISLLYMAVPLGIIGNCFGEVWNERDCILLKQTLKQRLADGGYTAFDIPQLFRTFDKNGDQLLDFAEFSEMLDVLRLGLSGDRVIKLFNFYDGDGGGTIDDEEFVKATFPGEYHQMFSSDDSSCVPGFRTKIANIARSFTMKSISSDIFRSIASRDFRSSDS